MLCEEVSNFDVLYLYDITFFTLFRHIICLADCRFDRLEAM